MRLYVAMLEKWGRYTACMMFNLHNKVFCIWHADDESVAKGVVLDVTIIIKLAFFFLRVSE